MEFNCEEEDEVKEAHHLWLGARDDDAAAVSAAPRATATDAGGTSIGDSIGAGGRGGALFGDDPHGGREARRNQRWGKDKQHSREHSRKKTERQHGAGADAAAGEGQGRGYLYEREHER